MEVSVLGPVEVRIDGSPVDLGTPKQRALVAALALSPGRPVSVDTIVDLLWGETPPASVSSTLQGYISHLRRCWSRAGPAAAPATVLVTVAPGYALAVPDDRVDARAFEATVARCRSRMREFQGWDHRRSPAPSWSESSRTSRRRWAAGGGCRTPSSGTPPPQCRSGPG